MKTLYHVFTSTPSHCRWTNTAISVFVCPSVFLLACLSARIIREPHVQTLPHFLYVSLVAVARSSADDSEVGAISGPT